MKKPLYSFPFIALVLLSIFLIAGIQINTQSFITVWKTDEPCRQTNCMGQSNSTFISFPTFSGETYYYDVGWNNDGVFNEFGITGNVMTHDFGTPRNKVIRIQRTFQRIYFNNTEDFFKILTIEQLGNIAWSSMVNAFYGMVYLADNKINTHGLSNVSDISNLFSDTHFFNSDMRMWDVSRLTNMRSMFFTNADGNPASGLAKWDAGRSNC